MSQSLLRQFFLPLSTPPQPVVGKAGGYYLEKPLFRGLLLLLTVLLGAASPALGQTISGTVFEDPNYGGGAGRNYAAANTSAVNSGFANNVIRRPGARVELYDFTVNTSGTYVTAETTDAVGAYSFSVTAGRNYRVRVVNSTVSSARPGWVSGLIPVSTYAGNDTDAVNRVGGGSPNLDDAGNGSTNLNALYTGAVGPATVSNLVTSATGTNVNFGFSFDVVCSERPSGAGSLRQFIINANALGNGNLAQQGKPAGDEVTIYMVPDGNAHPGLLPSPGGGGANQTNGAGLITHTIGNGGNPINANSRLPTITGDNTVLDATTQTANVGNNNPGIAASPTAGKYLGSQAGTAVGTGPDGVAATGDELTLTGTDAPEVEIITPAQNDDAGNTQYAISVDAANVRIRGYAFRQSSAYAIVSLAGNDASGLIVENNVFGLTPNTLSDPGGNNRVNRGVGLLGTGTNIIIRQNLFAYLRRSAVVVDGGNGGSPIATVLVENNEIRNVGLAAGTGGAITATDAFSALTIQGNRIGVAPASTYDGVTITYTDQNAGNGVAGATSILNNSILSADRYGVYLLEGTAGRSNNKQGTIARNLITGTTSDGIRHAAASGANFAAWVFSRNSITGSGDLGINLVGTDLANGVTLNDSGDGDNGPNRLLNYPVITSAVVIGANLEIRGFARNTSAIEFYKNAPVDASGFGEGQTYQFSATEASAADLDGTVGIYGPADVNGLAQGTDNTNRFRFLIPLPAGLAAGDFLSATATLASNGGTSEFGGRVEILATGTIQGTVFEDVNYGGGIGRAYTTANTSAVASGFATGVIRRANALVECYSNTGVLVDTTRTNPGGLYTFIGLPSGTYTIRVVNNTVTSARTGYVTSLIPVQTYAGTATNLVGGQAPQLLDAAANNPAVPVSLASLTNATATPQSLASVAVAAATVTGIDFGYNFDLIVSTRDAGQGSLRQFITNANALGNETLLAQAGSTRSPLGGGATSALPVDRETSIFMIPGGAAVAGQQAGLVNQLNASGVAVITVSTALPAVTGPNTGIDGRTQSFNFSNPNNLTLRAATTTGTNNLTVVAFNGLEVEIVGTAAVATGLDATAAATGFRVAGVSIYGFGANAAGNDADLRSAANTTLFTENVVGTTAASFTDVGTGRSRGTHVITTAGTGLQITNNLIGFGAGGGVRTLQASVTISNNEVRSNGIYAVVNQDGLDVRLNGFTITGNVVADNGAAGIELGSSTGAGTVTSNTVTGNGRQGTRTPGIRVGGSSSILSLNIISGNYGAGVLVIATAAGNRITQNAISDNGTVTTLSGGAASGQVGIDLLAGAADQQTGTAPFVTINDSGDGDSGGNGLFNFPVLTTIAQTGATLTVTGFARPNTIVEFFIPAVDGSSFGEGETYIATRTENLAGEDSDLAGTGLYGPGAINGLSQGTDNTNRFTFTLPFNALPALQQAAIIARGLTATGTLSNATSEFSGNVIQFNNITGTVFEDVNYGGGSGRNRATAELSAVASGFAAGTIRRPNARVELYDASGTFVQATTTDASGQYTLVGVPNGNLTVRVVNNTVRSVRPGNIAGLLPVQTYAGSDANRVGGEAPEKVDGPSAVISATSSVLVELVGLNPGGGDNTAFIDQVAVTGQPAAVLNSSFETPSQGGGYSYNTPGATWAFDGSSGLAANGSGFGPPAPPNGTQVAFIQMSGTASQSITLTPGSYTLTLRAAQRNCCGTNDQRIDVRVNGVSIGSIQPANNGVYASFSAPFVVTASSPTTLATLNTATTIAQSQAPVTVSGASVTGVDFGYSFDVVCNTLNAGQGSLRQFLINANTLTNANLAQAGQTAGRETSIFMIPSGAAVAGLRAGLASGLTGPIGDQRAIIQLPAGGAVLPVTDTNTTIDGSTQTANVGDTNIGTLGSTEEVGVDELPVLPVNQSEVEIVGNSGVSTVLSLTGTNATLRGLAIRGGSFAAISITGTGYRIEDNIIGTSSIVYDWPGDATSTGSFCLSITANAVGIVQNNLVGFSGNSGIDIDNGLTTVGVTTIQGNQFNQNGYNSPGGDGISLGDSGGSGPMLIQGNLFTRSNSSAVQFEIQQTSVSQILNNTMVSCGKGGAGAAQSSLEGSAICYLQRTGARRGTQADVISRNIIVDTQASGIVVGYGQSNIRISENSIFNSGSIAIDLIVNPNAYVGGPGLGAVEYGSGDGVNLNDGVVAALPTGLPNRGTDFPILVSLDIEAGNLVVDGFSRPGATIELFVPQLDFTRFGEGRTFLYSRVEGSADDSNAGTGSYGPGAVNSLLQGQDANAARFRFTVPFASLPATTQAAILTNGLTSTATLNGNTSEFSGDVTLRADVYTIITPAAPSVGAGLTGQFNVVFGNTGPSTATGIIAVVQLPSGLSGVAATNGGVYNVGTGLVTYAGLTSLLDGQTIVSNITFTQPVFLGAVTGSASISTTTNENGLYTNNVRTATILTEARFDLTTAISGPTTTVAGVLVTYGITTTNLGPGSAPNVVQTVQLPTGLLDVFVTNGGTYDAGTGVVTFPALPGLASGQRRNNAVSFPAPAANFALTASVTPITGDLNPANNTTAVPFSTTVTGPAGAPANVYITVSSNAPNAGVAPGTPVTFTVNQGNHGPQPATGVAARLELPPGLFGASVSGGGTYNALTGVVTWPPVASQPTATAQAPLTVTVNAPGSGLLTATANVVTTSADPVAANNVATTEVTLTNVNVTDVRVTLVGPARAIAGQGVTYTVTTTNAGINTATDVSPTVQLPAGLNSVVVNNGGTYNSVTGTVSFPATAALIPGDYLHSSITFVTPLNDANSLPLTAGVFTTSTELAPANNVSRTSTQLQAYADIRVQVTGPAITTVGSPITYVVTTLNNGPAVSNGHTLTVQLPTGLTGVVVVGGGVYTAQSGVVTFTAVNNQLPGPIGSLVRTISFAAPDRSFVTPSAAVTTPGNDDPITTNNLSVFTTAILTQTAARANLATTISSNLGTQTAGAPVTFTVGTSNSGPNAATGVIQQVALLPGLLGVIVSGGGTYDTSTGIVTWNLPDLANGGSASRTVSVNTPGRGPLLASAIVTANETDLTTANNRATTSVNITPAADVAIAVNGRDVSEPGATVTYSVTTVNNGASPATNVVQTVQLPTGLAGVLVTSGSYNSGTGVVTFPTIFSHPLGSAGVVTNTITFTAPATSYSVVGTVTSGTPDPIAANNSDSQNTSTSVNRRPVARDVVNTLQAPRGETSTVTNLLSALEAVDPDGVVVSYAITALPTGAQGVLALGGVAVTLNQVLTPTEATQLTFTPTTGFVGNAFFRYTATGTLAAVSNEAIYTIPVGRDNAALYSYAPVQGGQDPYSANDDIATVFDANGGEYAAGPVVTDNGTRSVFLAGGSNPLPAGVALDAISGRLYVTDPALLMSGTYTVTITTIDEFAGETTQPVTFTIGNTPLPVELVRFDARARGRVADLIWQTASEKNNAWFVVERATDGRTFTEIGRVAGAGTTATAHEYALVDQAPRPGLNYYRLRQLDADGKATLSDVRTLRFGTAPAVGAVWPNPFTDVVQVDLSGYPTTEAVAATLYDATGRCVYQATLVGGTIAPLDLRAVATGAYVIRLTAADGSGSTIRLVRD